MPTDQQLIAAFLTHHDKRAFASLVTRYQSSIRQFLRRMTAGDYALADDIAQECFLVMYKKLHTFQGQAALSTWLHKVAYRCFLKQVKKQQQIELVDDSELLNFESVEADLVTDITLERLMQKLSVDERLTITLAYSAGMSHGEIVEVTGFPLGTVKSHINRGKAKLSTLLAEKQPNPKGAVA